MEPSDAGGSLNVSSAVEPASSMPAAFCTADHKEALKKLGHFSMKQGNQKNGANQLQNYYLKQAVYKLSWPRNSNQLSLK